MLVLAAVAWLLPHPAALILTPTDPDWAASHHRWTAVLATALVAFLWASHEPERRQVPRGWRLTVLAIPVLLVGAGAAFALRSDSGQRTAAPSGGIDTGTQRTRDPADPPGCGQTGPPAAGATAGIPRGPAGGRVRVVGGRPHPPEA